MSDILAKMNKDFKVQFAADTPGIPRRIRLDLLTPIERQARQLLVDIEALGAHPVLTGAMCTMQTVRELLADWVDAGKPGEATAPATTKSSPNGEDLED